MTNALPDLHAPPSSRARRALRYGFAIGLLASTASPITALAQPSEIIVDIGDPPTVPDDNYVTTTTVSQRSLDVSAFSPSCVRDVPYISFTIVPRGFSSNGPATLTVFDAIGNFVEQVTSPTLSGQIIFPGAEAGANGEGVDWPGWKRAPDGSWMPDPSDAVLREGLTIQVDVGGTMATATVSYPDADSPCANPPDGTPPATTQPCVPGQNNDANAADDCSLATTGGGPGNALLIGAGALIAGLLLYAAARRRQQDQHAPRAI